MDPRRERFLRAWAETTPRFDKDHGRERFLSAQRRKRAARPRRVAAWLAAAAILLFAGVFTWSRWSAPITFTASNGQSKVGAWLATGAAAELSLTFSEGTQVVLESDSRGRVEQLDRAGAHFLLDRGAFHADIVHRAGTDWRFHAGPFEILVTGTSLAVAWEPRTEQFTLTVEKGSVVVHGPYVGGDQVVRAGERCVVDVPAKSMRLTTGDDAPAPSSSVEAPPPSQIPSAIPPLPSAGPHVAPSLPVTPSWSALEERGDYDGAYAAARRAGLHTLYEKAGADDLLRLSQVGRLSGHRDVERDALLACRRRFPGTPAAGLAAYELGRASVPAEAVTWFDAYLREVPDGSLAREAQGRLMEAHALAGNDAAARDGAKRYLARYPDGPHAALARRILARSNGE
jgi:hypothetical protein